MAVPKKRHTKSRRDKRRSHLYLEKVELSPCSKCGELKRAHTVCPNCGYYKGEAVLDVMKKLSKKERKKKEKEIKEKEKEKTKKPLSWEGLSQK